LDVQVTPELVAAVGKVAVDLVGAIGTLIATVACVILGRKVKKTTRDIDIAHDRIRELRGEPPQQRYLNPRPIVVQAASTPEQAEKPAG